MWFLSRFASVKSRSARLSRRARGVRAGNSRRCLAAPPAHRWLAYNDAISVGYELFMHSVNEVTRILSAVEQGDPHAAEQLLPLVYDELRKLAAEKMAQEKPGQTLEATALVHEAYIRLVDVDKVQHWNSRGHFFAAAAEAMRRILVDRKSVV